MLYWLFTGGAKIAVYSAVPSLLISGLTLLLAANALSKSEQRDSGMNPTGRERRLRRLTGSLSAFSVMQPGILILSRFAVQPGYARITSPLLEALAALLVGPPAILRQRLLASAFGLMVGMIMAGRAVGQQLRDSSKLREVLERRRDPARIRREMGSAHFCSPREYSRFRQVVANGWELHGAFWGKAGQEASGRFIRLDDGEGRFCLSGEDASRGFLALGGQGSGKTQSVILPAIADRMAAGHSVVVADPQGELRSYLLRFSAITGHPIIIHDPTDPASARFNLATNVRTVSDAKAVAEVLMPTSERGNFWHDSASGLCAACLLRFDNIGQILEAATNMEGLASRLAEQDDEARRLAASFIANAKGESQRTAAGTLSTLVTAIDGWASSVVCQTTSATDFGAEDLMEVPGVILLSCPGRQRAVYARYLGAVLRKLILDLDAIGERQKDGILPLPTAVVLDEFPALGRLDAMVENVNMVRKRRISFIIAAQTKGQFHLIYGREGTEALLSGFATQLVFGGCDQETADFYSHASGTATETLSGGETERSIARRLLTPDEIQTPARGNATLFTRYTTETFATQLIMAARPTRLYDRHDWAARLTGVTEHDALLVASPAQSSSGTGSVTPQGDLPPTTVVNEWPSRK